MNRPSTRRSGSDVDAKDATVQRVHFLEADVLRLKFLRIERGLSQHQLAALANVPQSDLSRIETGRGIPTRSELSALAAALDCAADRLMDAVSAEVTQ